MVGLKLNTGKCIQRDMVALINIKLQHKTLKCFFGLTIKQQIKVYARALKSKQNRWI